MAYNIDDKEKVVRFALFISVRKIQIVIQNKNKSNVSSEKY